MSTLVVYSQSNGEIAHLLASIVFHFSLCCYNLSSWVVQNYLLLLLNLTL